MEWIRSWAWTEQGLTWGGKILVSLLVLLFFWLLTKVLTKMITKFIQKRAEKSRKEQTLLQLLFNVIRVTLFFWAIFTILDLFGVNTTSMLATAGIGGIALGFGAQSLVKDVLTGAMLLLEDQFSVGDYIRIGALEGYVRSAGLRLTTLESFAGELHFVPNGSITAVTNLSRTPMRAKADIRIPDGTDMDQLLPALKEAVAAFAASWPHFVKKPEVLGITGYTERGLIVTVAGTTEPMYQWEAEREIRQIAWRCLLSVRKQEEVGHVEQTER